MSIRNSHFCHCIVINNLTFAKSKSVCLALVFTAKNVNCILFDQRVLYYHIILIVQRIQQPILKLTLHRIFSIFFPKVTRLLFFLSKPRFVEIQDSCILNWLLDLVSKINKFFRKHRKKPQCTSTKVIL